MQRVVCVQNRSRVVTPIFSRELARGRVALMKLSKSQRLAPATMYFNEPLNHGILSNYARQEAAGAARACADVRDSA